jgi:hypothetical protein
MRCVSGSQRQVSGNEKEHGALTLYQKDLGHAKHVLV